MERVAAPVHDRLAGAEPASVVADAGEDLYEEVADKAELVEPGFAAEKLVERELAAGLRAAAAVFVAGYREINHYKSDPIPIAGFAVVSG